MLSTNLHRVTSPGALKTRPFGFSWRLHRVHTGVSHQSTLRRMELPGLVQAPEMALPSIISQSWTFPGVASTNLGSYRETEMDRLDVC